MYLPPDCSLSQGMSCYLLQPGSPYVKVALVPGMTLIGYQGYQTGPQGLPAPIAATASTGTSRVSLGPGAQLSAAAALNFTSGQLQQLASMPTDLSGTLLPSLDANLNYVLPGSGGLRSPNGGRCRMALKRKSCGADSESSSDSIESADSEPHNATLHPLYCKVCRVTLNAPAQAKQHYEGKTHAKKAKLYADALEAEKLTPACALKTSASSQNSEGGASGAETTEGVSGPPKKATKDIHPEIYCKVCGVSFNSSKQAKQHYGGKNHAKKLRSTRPHRGRGSDRYRFNSKFTCFVCKLHLPSREDLETHVETSGHLIGRHRTKSLTDKVEDSVHVSCRRMRSGAVADFAMFRTPSGLFYCSCCNMTLTSDSHMTSHVDSRQHRVAAASSSSSLLLHRSPLTCIS